jgi:hypothetical protein
MKKAFAISYADLVTVLVADEDIVELGLPADGRAGHRSDDPRF